MLLSAFLECMKHMVHVQAPLTLYKILLKKKNEVWDGKYRKLEKDNERKITL